MGRNGYEPLRREYSRTASRYDARWSFYVEASIRETLSRFHVAPADRVLDVGCGTGALLEALSAASPGVELAGVDLSAEMLGIARRRLGPGSALIQARAEALPFGDAAFDAVISSSAIHFMRHPVEALQEMRRVLKPSGKVVITDWCDDYFTCRVLDRFLHVFDRAHFRTYGAGECRELLQDVGFTDVEVERYKINWFWGLMTATAVRDAD